MYNATAEIFKGGTRNFLPENTGLNHFPDRYWLARGGEELLALLYPCFEGERWRVRADDQGYPAFSPKDGPGVDNFPTGLAKAPFRWQYYSREYNMEFLGGFVGVRQDSETLRLRPEIGWAVRDAVGP